MAPPPGQDNHRAFNGLKRQWPQIAAVASVIGSMFFGLIVWGLSNQYVTDESARRIANIEAILSTGVLPRTDERLRALEREIETMRRERDQLLQELASKQIIDQRQW